MTGHETGDRLLVAVARRLSAAVGPGDTVARQGGDEFAILTEQAAPATAVALADRILAALQAPFDADGKEVTVGVSIGIALRSADWRTSGELLRNADLALYCAKSAGKNCYRFFESGMYSAVVGRMDLEADLRRALGAGEFELHYQPTVAVKTGRICGVEALLRWRHPHRGMISPAQFIPLAEETGLIVPLGRWVLEESCRQARQWQAEFPMARPLTMSVNLSVRQLGDPHFLADVERILHETDLPPASLVLEITESIFLESTADTLETLRRLRGLGVRLALDDFGTGYSSLGYLKQFPMDVLKIDQSFIRSLSTDGWDHDLMVGILELARALRMVTVAEGVEREEQRLVLQRLGCSLAQGYYFSRPVLPGEITALLNRTGKAVSG